MLARALPSQVAICTPGRMIDLIKIKACTMKRVTYLVGACLPVAPTLHCTRLPAAVSFMRVLQPFRLATPLLACPSLLPGRRA